MITYRYKKLPKHPRANPANGCIRLHVLGAEKALGKPLPDNAVIHHHDKEQLVICQDQAYHMLIHQRMRRYVQTGVASAPYPGRPSWKPEHRKPYMRNYYAKNKERMRAYQNEWRRKRTVQEQEVPPANDSV